MEMGWKGVYMSIDFRCWSYIKVCWTNYLRPDLKRGLLTESEEQLVIDLHAHLGSRWSIIASKLSGRTNNKIKNHWNTHIKKKLLKLGIDPVTHERLPKEVQTGSKTSPHTEHSLGSKHIQISQPFESTNNPGFTNEMVPQIQYSSSVDNKQENLFQTVCDDEKLLSCLLDDDGPHLLDALNWESPVDDKRSKNCTSLLVSWDKCTTWLIDCQDFGVDDFGLDFLNKVEMNFENMLEMDKKRE